MKYPRTTWAALSEEQIEAAAKLTPVQQMLVDNLLVAARELPKGFSLEVDEDGLVVRKQITAGYHHCVAKLRRRTLNSDHLTKAAKKKYWSE